MALSIGAGNGYIDYATSAVWGNSQKTIDATIFYAGTPKSMTIQDTYWTGTNVNEAYFIVINTSGKIKFGQQFLTGSTPNYSYWDSDTAISTGINRIAITYNNSSALNDPIFYANGISKPLTVGFRNTNSVISGTANTVQIFGGDAANILYNYNLYNRIFTASEVLEAYNSRLSIPTRRGLVFAPQLWGCAGGVAEGGTLAAGNTIADAVSGALGTPAGSPVFKGDNYLTFQE